MAESENVKVMTAALERFEAVFRQLSTKPHELKWTFPPYEGFYLARPDITIDGIIRVQYNVGTILPAFSVIKLDYRDSRDTDNSCVDTPTNLLFLVAALLHKQFPGELSPNFFSQKKRIQKMLKSKLEQIAKQIETLQLAHELNTSRKALKCVLTEVKDVFEAVSQNRKLIAVIPVETLLAKIDRAFKIDEEQAKGKK